MKRHLAQFNIARLKYPEDDPRVGDFVNNLTRINKLAERSKGFVWQLQDENGVSITFDYKNDPMMTTNLTVWESPRDLANFVWRTVHKKFYQRRHEWFEKTDLPYMAMWWIETGSLPTFEEGVARLDHLKEHGPSEYVFGWDSLKEVDIWKQSKCA